MCQHDEINYLGLLDNIFINRTVVAFSIALSTKTFLGFESGVAGLFFNPSVPPKKIWLMNEDNSPNTY